MGKYSLSLQRARTAHQQHIENAIKMNDIRIPQRGVGFTTKIDILNQEYVGCHAGKGLYAHGKPKEKRIKYIVYLNLQSHHPAHMARYIDSRYRHAGPAFWTVC